MATQPFSLFIEIAYLVLFKQGDRAATITHPIVLAPFIGLILILIAMFQPQPNKKLVYTAIAAMGILVAILLLIGIMGANYRMALATFPFLLSSVWCFRLFKRGVYFNA